VYIPVLVPVGGVVLFRRRHRCLLKESVETRTIVLNSFNNQCTSRYNKVIMKVMHGINMANLLYVMGPNCPVKLSLGC
jgi:hypothetical protein